MDARRRAIVIVMIGSIVLGVCVCGLRGLQHMQAAGRALIEK
ncbi:MULTISPECIES: hypothetical protein [unclassified Beijerinckia]|nr:MULTISPECIES: hypothetical protein [unclassified Beijerinckia]MDH7797192.1 hypothetical protein [Beijerinckia sp. GAS462]